MSLATITSKGQVTIPKSIRESLHLRTGDRIEIVVKSSGEAVLRPVTKKVDDVYGTLSRVDGKSFSTDEMDGGIKRRMRERSR